MDSVATNFFTYLASYPGAGSIIGGLLTGIGTVSAVVWASWRQSAESKRRRRAFTSNFYFVCIQSFRHIIALVTLVENKSADVKDAEWDADAYDRMLTDFPMYELPDVLVEEGQDFRAWFGVIHAQCKVAIRDGGSVTPEFKATVFAAFGPLYERLEHIRKYAQTKYDQAKYMEDFHRERERFFEEYKKELESADKKAATTTASAGKRWWPF